MKATYGGMEFCAVWASSFNGNEWSVSRSGRCTFRDTTQYSIVGWSGSFRKENISCLCQAFSLDSEFLFIKETMKCLLEEERVGSSPYVPKVT
jgi:hypothetical protein